VDVTLIAVVEIMVAWDEKSLRKRPGQFFERLYAVVQRMKVDRRSVIVPITQEQTSVAPLSLAYCDYPVNKPGAV
jgi:hypothetical protein